MGSLLLAIIYLCFISLGLPDALLGSAWPVLHTELSVPLSYAGLVSSTIMIGTILSSFASDKLLRRFGTGGITVISTFLTALGLFGFSISKSFIHLILFAIPYGLGAGAVDAVLNNYVALHYKPQHMNWLHGMWGLGATVSPYIMSFSLARLHGWSFGYLIVAVVQLSLAVFMLFTLPMWKKSSVDEATTHSQPPTLREIFTTRGTVACFIVPFVYCALEMTTTLWASSYLVTRWDMTPEFAAGLSATFYFGITVGRLISGFLAMRLSDKALIRLGSSLVGLGILLLLLPVSPIFTVIGFIIIGLGSAPIYPCIIHTTPIIFGPLRSGALIGFQMGFAYLGFLIVPPIFGLIAEYISMSLLPLFLAVFLLLIVIFHERVVKISKNTK